MKTKLTYYEKLQDPRWQRKRLEIMERDGFACKNCDATDKTLNVHHLYYSKCEPWEYPNEALVTYCKECHRVAQDATNLLLEMVVRGTGGKIAGIIAVADLCKSIDPNSQEEVNEFVSKVLALLAHDYLGDMIEAIERAIQLDFLMTEAIEEISHGR